METNGNDKREFEVQINRVHAGAPYNCAAYIPSVWCENEDDVINLPEVQKLINKTYGKRFTVHVMPVRGRSYLQYEVAKHRAVIN